jgi:hypothetical protein
MPRLWGVAKGVCHEEEDCMGGDWQSFLGFHMNQQRRGLEQGALGSGSLFLFCDVCLETHHASFSSADATIASTGNKTRMV